MSTVWQVFSFQCLGGAPAATLQNQEWILGINATVVVPKGARWPGPTATCVARWRNGSPKQQERVEGSFGTVVQNVIRAGSEVCGKQRICRRVTSATLRDAEMRTTAKGCHHFAHGRLAIRLHNRACVPKRKRELCTCSDNIQMSRSFPRHHACTRRSSFVTTKSVIESDHGENVLGVGEDRLVLFPPKSRADWANGSACVVLCRPGQE